MNEIWKPVRGYEGLYEVSNVGRVRSMEFNVTEKTGKTRIHYGKIMKTYVNENGYVIVRLTKNEKSKLWRVHRLVAFAFIPMDPNKPVVNHKDGNKQNNTIDNLEWTTSSENNYHAFRIGLKNSDSRSCGYRITIDGYTFTERTAKKAARKLHKDGYFTNVSTVSLSTMISTHAKRHALYMGVMKAERLDDPYDVPQKYRSNSVKWRSICAELPSGLTPKAVGPENLVKFVRRLGYLTDIEFDAVVKGMTEAAQKGRKYHGIRVRYIDK